MPRKPHDANLGTLDDVPRPILAADVVLLTVIDRRLHALAVRRSHAPAEGTWSLPGVLVGADEPLDAAAARALSDKGGVDGVFLEQLFTFGAPGRDPRARIVSVAHFALVPSSLLDAALSGERPDVRLAQVDVDWPGELGGPAGLLDEHGAPLQIAFDHAEILGRAVQRVRGKLDYSDIAFELLPESFPLRDLQQVHEAILGRSVNRDSFRRRMLQSGLVVATGARESGTTFRPAELYRHQVDLPRPHTPRTRKARP